MTTPVVIAAFASEAAFSRAYEEAGRRALPVVDAFAPFLPEIARTDSRDRGPARMAAAVAIGGFGLAIAFFLVEAISAAVLYPFDSGDRPLFSWPAFVMGPFEFGVFSAGFCGFVALLALCGLPRPHQPLFDARGIEMATQDRFFIALAASDEAEALVRELGGQFIQRMAI
jgi:hypothetical protein